jgi:hypothetical protein
MGMIDHHLAQAGIGQSLQVPRDQRFATHRQKRFRRVVGQGPHSFAATGRENHDLHWANAQ